MNLFSPLQMRELTLRSRIIVSPMCQYSSEDGFANDWHLVHLGSLARGGAALVFTEATAVSDIGRISPQDLGIYRDEHGDRLKQIAEFIKSQGAVPGIQLNHAGRKASTVRPWDKGITASIEAGGWEPIGPGSERFADGYPRPRAMTLDDIKLVKSQFVAAAKRALEAGFQVVEIHAAHGYLLHQFLSPLSNHRTDDYGGTPENRARLLLEVLDEIRTIWPAEWPVMVRISATDWTEGGLTITDTIQVAKWMKEHGAEMIDVSTGGNVAHAKIPVGPGYQITFAEQIRKGAGIPTAAVGMITSPHQAESILASGQADAVVLARELLRNPHWPATAARALGVNPVYIPNQYARAW